MTRTVQWLGPLATAGLFAASAVGADEVGVADLARLDADVVILGEIHDNPIHHVNQATAVAALKPRALVFEMFGPGAALAVTPERRRDPEALELALGWEDSGWPDFAMYFPIFVAAPDAAVFGGAMPRAAVRRALDVGAAAAFGPGGSLFGLDQPLAEDEQAARETGQLRVHCDALPASVLPGMVAAQRVRDAALSQAVVAAMAETGGPVAVITGNGHGRTDWGIPRMLSRTLPDARVLSIGQFEDAAPEDPPHDLWLVTEAAERPDPCEAFR